MSHEEHMRSLKTIHRKLARRQKGNPFLYALGAVRLYTKCLFRQGPRQEKDRIPLLASSYRSLIRSSYYCKSTQYIDIGVRGYSFLPSYVLTYHIIMVLAMRVTQHIGYGRVALL